MGNSLLPGIVCGSLRVKSTNSRARDVSLQDSMLSSEREV